MQRRTQTLIRRAFQTGLAAAVLAAAAGCGPARTPAPVATYGAAFFPSTNTSHLFAKRQNRTPISNQLIVKAKGPQDLTSLLTQDGRKIVGKFTADTTYYLVETPGSYTSSATILAKHPAVEFVQPNYEVKLQMAPNDPLYKDQWGMEKVNGPQAWEVTTGKSDFIVAVVDTGVDYNHPDLAANVIKGGDYTGESKDGKDPIDSFGHGTHCAGIVAAIANNGTGVTGIAPSVKVMAVKVLGAKGNGNLFAIAAGITYAVNNGAKVVSLSLGGPAVNDPISTSVGWWAFKKKGALLVAASGNEGGKVGTPARIDDYYMAVGASDDADKLTKFSNFGKELSVVAPGAKIMSTTPTYKVPLNDLGYSQNYAALNGTSMACPLVAGTAALVWSRHPGWTNQQVREHLEKTATDLGTKGKDDTFGWGRIDAFAAVK